MKKQKTLILTAVVAGFIASNLSASAIDNEYSNQLLKLNVEKAGNNDVNVTVYSSKAYKIKLNPVKKSNGEYVIFLPSTYHSITAKPDVTKTNGMIDNVDVKLIPFTGSQKNNGFTKITIKTGAETKLNINNEVVKTNTVEDDIANLLKTKFGNQNEAISNHKPTSINANNQAAKTKRTTAINSKTVATHKIIELKLNKQNIKTKTEIAFKVRPKHTIAAIKPTETVSTTKKATVSPQKLFEKQKSKSLMLTKKTDMPVSTTISGRQSKPTKEVQPIFAPPAEKMQQKLNTQQLSQPQESKRLFLSFPSLIPGISLIIAVLLAIKLLKRKSTKPSNIHSEEVENYSQQIKESFSSYMEQPGIQNYSTNEEYTNVAYTTETSETIEQNYAGHFEDTEYINYYNEAYESQYEEVNYEQLSEILEQDAENKQTNTLTEELVEIPEPEVLDGFDIADNKGIYLVQTEAEKVLIGVVNSRVFVLNSFNNDENLTFKINKSKEQNNKQLFFVKVGKWQGLISADEQKVNLELAF